MLFFVCLFFFLISRANSCLYVVDFYFTFFFMFAAFEENG